MAISEHEERAVRTALHLHPLGFCPKPEDVEACQAKEDAGVLRRLNNEGERPAYVATTEAVEALGQWHAMQAQRN